MPDLVELGHALSVWFLPVVIAITFHEAAHGWTALKLGDDTAYRMGRVTFNPVKHVDPIGTFVLPGILLYLSGGRFMLGWAKPVPVAFHRLNNPRRDMILVALAGPGINIALAIACLLILHPIGQLRSGPAALWVWENLWNAVSVNVILACFNMLPIPPLDGGRVVTGLLPYEAARRYARIEPFGIFLLLGIIFLVPMVTERLGMAIQPLEWVLLPFIYTVFSVLQTLTGW